MCTCTAPLEVTFIFCTRKYSLSDASHKAPITGWSFTPARNQQVSRIPVNISLQALFILSLASSVNSSWSDWSSWKAWSVQLNYSQFPFICLFAYLAVHVQYVHVTSGLRYTISWSYAKDVSYIKVRTFEGLPRVELYNCWYNVVIYVIHVTYLWSYLMVCSTESTLPQCQCECLLFGMCGYYEAHQYYELLVIDPRCLRHSHIIFPCFNVSRAWRRLTKQML